MATRERVLRLAEGATHLHIASHGKFDLDHPLESRLLLAAQDSLSVRELRDHHLNLSTVRIAVLSACQAAITNFRDVPDDAVGFASAFLLAAVPGVVGTLWRVDDMSTAVVLSRFYRLLVIDGLDADVALHAAQRRAREATALPMGLAEMWERYAQGSRGIALNAQRWIRYCRAQPDFRPFAEPCY